MRNVKIECRDGKHFSKTILNHKNIEYGEDMKIKSKVKTKDVIQDVRNRKKNTN